MVDLNELLVCSVCHSDLVVKRIRSNGSVSCSRCGRNYTLNEDVYDMTPLASSDEVLKSKWDTWQKLQDNGLLSYTNAPELNLSVATRPDVLAFKTFSEPSGLILDIGCGSLTYPAHLPDAGGVVGIDPMLGQQPRGFAFVQGIGEYLPFRDKTFDHVVYASSLDHLMDPKRSLTEAARCLKDGGHISLWLDGLDSNVSSGRQSRWERYQMLARKGFKSLSRHGWISGIGLRRTLFYMISVARMKVPEGAVDYFHFVNLSLAIVSDWLKERDLTIIRQQEYPSADSVFIQVKKEARTQMKERACGPGVGTKGDVG